MPLVGLAISVTDAPLQITPSSFAVPDVSDILTVALGNVFTVTEVDVDAEQAVVELVTVTEYALVDEGDMEILSLVPPGEDHE